MFLAYSEAIPQRSTFILDSKYGIHSNGLDLGLPSQWLPANKPMAHDAALPGVQAPKLLTLPLSQTSRFFFLFPPLSSLCLCLGWVFFEIFFWWVPYTAEHFCLDPISLERLKARTARSTSAAAPAGTCTARRPLR